MTALHVRTALVAGALALALPLRAQVGVIPEQSPFRDVETKQDLTFFVGLGGGRDLAGAAPSGGVLWGVRHDLYVTGPASFTSRFTMQLAERDELRTRGAPPASRVARTVAQPLYFADVGVTLNLTGRKSWRNVVPSLNGGLGIVGDFRAADSNGFRFGNRLALQFGAGLKWHARGRWTVRADLANYFYNVSYPASFRILAPTPPEQPVLPITAGLSSWTRNTMLQVGITRHFGR